VSFTRAAVKEAKQRLSFNSAYATVLCLTIDSFSGHLNQLVSVHVGSGIDITDYEQNICTALKFIQGFCHPTQSSVVRKYISEQIDLLIIDEAQDIFDDRASLMRTVIEYLHHDARVLLLGDPMQEIYDFSTDSESVSLLGQIIGGTCLVDRQFKQLELKTNHRTKNSNLLSAYRLSRDVYKTKHGTSMLRDLRDVLARSSVPSINAVEWSQNTDSLPGPWVCLFRRNIDALKHYIQTLSIQGQSSLRVSHIGRGVDPLLAVLFFGSDLDKLESLDSIWSRIDISYFEAIRPDLDVGEYIDTLEGLYGRSNGIDLARIYADIKFNRLPSYLTNDSVGRGPNIYSSIHSYKGRESERVALYLPQNLRSLDSSEYRVYYVGITRATQDLRIIDFIPEKMKYMKFSGRAYSSEKLRVEIGRSGDVAWSLDESAYSVQALNGRHLWLSKHINTVRRLYLYLNERTSTYDILDALEKRCIGCLSQWAFNDIRSICYPGKMPYRMTNLYLCGARTAPIHELCPVGGQSVIEQQILNKLQDFGPRLVLLPNIVGIAEPVR
jgi:hypothetical protein